MTPPITGADLPPLGWHHDNPFDPAAFDPVTRVPMRGEERAKAFSLWFTKPFPGGLWTTPLETIEDSRGPVVGNIWLAGGGGVHHRPDTAIFQEITAHPDATIYVIDNPDDLDDAIARWPDPHNGYKFGDPDTAYEAIRPDVIDWPAMANDYDAVYVTHMALRDLNNAVASDYANLPPHRRAKRNRARHLHAWDVPTVLFLQPRLHPGTVHHIDAAHISRYRAARQAHAECDAIELRQKIIDEVASNGGTLPDFILKLPAEGFLLLVGQALNEDADA